MPVLRSAALAAISASAILTIAPEPRVPPASEPGIDRSVRPGDDFYRYANGAWLKAAKIPLGQTSYDDRALLREKTGRRVSDVIHDAAASHPAGASVAQKVGDYYASLLDEAAIDAHAPAMLASELARIAAIDGPWKLSSYLGTTLNVESDGLIANSDHVFGLWVNQGFSEWTRNVPHLMQGGLGMPDRDSYLDPSPAMAESRARYRRHVAAMLRLAGIGDSDAGAGRVLSLETRMAQAFAPDADAADVFKQNNPWKRADFPVKAPGMDWEACFQAAGLAGESDFLVWQPTAVTGVSALVRAENLEAWRDYLRFHLLEHYAVALPAAFATEHSAFTQQPLDRDAVAIAATNGALGQAVGQLYTDRYFPPEAKAAAQAMARGLVAAYRGRISNLTWMSPETKQKALAKLAAFTIGVGYPDDWIDYSSLEVVRGDAFGNMRRAEDFQRRRSLQRLKQPADPAEWRIDPQAVGAVIVFTPNSEFFSAGILQPPFFDANGDAAANYGSAGAGMAHEISHSFDELGNIYDAHGLLGNWWTEEDKTRYHAAAAGLVAQFGACCPLPGLCVDGQRVSSESIADVAGLLVAHDAYVSSLEGKPDVVIGGWTGEQRFFLAFARRWRKVQSEAALRKQVETDTHAPGEYRSETVRNVGAWYEAFQIVPGDKLYLRPEDRVRIW